MRIISLWEPWAELIFRLQEGSDSDYLKGWETRTFRIEPGELAIHASKKKFISAHYTQEFRTQLLMDSVDPYWLQYGVVLGVVTVTESLKVEEIRDRLSARELMYGNYDSTCPVCVGGKLKPVPACEDCGFTGIKQRYASRMVNVRRLPKPVALKGMQGFFHWKEGKTVCEEAFQ
jgi:hypothetical protein